MKRNILKVVAFLSIAIMAFALAGCGEKKDETVTLDWYLPKSIDNVDNHVAVEKYVNEIIEPKICAKVNLHLIDRGNYDQKMNVLISSGDTFDICFTSAWTNSFTMNAGRGAYLELNDLLDKYGKNIMAKADPRAIEAVTRNGKIMAVPGQGAYSTPIGFVFKKELVDKYNIDYKSIDSYEKLIPYLEIIKKNEPDIIPLEKDVPLEDIYPFTDIGVTGVLYNEETGKVVSRMDVQPLIDQYRMRHDFYKKGYFAADVLTKTDKMAEAKTGRYAVLSNTGVYTEDGSKSTAAYGYPCVESYMYNSPITTGLLFGALNGISVTSKNPEKAVQLLDLIWGDEYLSNTMAYGIEGVDYIVDEKSTPEKKTVIPNTGAEQKWAIWHNYLGPLFDQWDSSWNSAESLAEMKANNEKGVISNVLGFTFDTTPVKTELAQLSSIHSEVKDILSTGAMLDFDEFIEQTRDRYKAAGIDKVLAEVEKQLAEHKELKK